jgi:AcrR family transcriptional regulator
MFPAVYVCRVNPYSYQKMSPRPRRLSDAAILEAAFEVVQRTGPDRFTLADVGQEVGLSAATLVQRFGSKRSLLLAMLQQSVTQTDDRFARSVKAGESPIETLYSAVLDRFRTVEHPDTLSNGFAFLMIELSDPEFHVLAAESANNAISGYRTLLDAAIEAGELDDSLDSQHLAETIHALTWGALMMWAIIRMLSPQDRLKRSLDILLTPYRRELAGASSFAAKPAAKGPETKAPVPAKD